MTTIYPANLNGQPIDQQGNVVAVDFSLYNGQEVVVFDTYDEYLYYIQQMVSPQE